MITIQCYRSRSKVTKIVW